VRRGLRAPSARPDGVVQSTVRSTKSRECSHRAKGPPGPFGASEHDPRMSTGWGDSHAPGACLTSEPNRGRGTGRVRQNNGRRTPRGKPPPADVRPRRLLLAPKPTAHGGGVGVHTSGADSPRAVGHLRGLPGGRRQSVLSSGHRRVARPPTIHVPLPIGQEKAQG
jgi:hypothetical protein